MCIESLCKWGLVALALAVCAAPVFAQTDDPTWDGKFKGLLDGVKEVWGTVFLVALLFITPIMGAVWLWRNGRRSAGLRPGGRL